MPTVIDGHELIRDRAPCDDPIRLTAWRWRWLCTCGGSGNWHLDGAREVERGWHKHLQNLRDRSVPRSTTHRTTS